MSNPEEKVVVDAPVEETATEEVVEVTDAPIEEVLEVEPSDAPEELPLSDEAVAPAEELGEELSSEVELPASESDLSFAGEKVVSAKVVEINGKNYVEVTVASGTKYNSPIDSVSKELLDLAQSN